MAKEYLDKHGLETLVDSIPKTFTGSLAEWNALTLDEKVQYTHALIEDATSSVQGVQLLFVGQVAAFICPPASPHWILCDGSTVDPGAHPILASRCPVLPDLRECVLRGAGTNTTYFIATHNALDLNEFQDDALQKMTGSTGWGVVTDHETSGGSPSGVLHNDGVPRGRTWNGTGGDDIRRLGFDSARVARSDTTTHDKSVGVYYYVYAD